MTGGGGGLAGALGEGVVQLLRDNGYVAVPREEHRALECVREKYEIAASSLLAIADFGETRARSFAEVSIRRMTSPDGATPFADMRKAIRVRDEEIHEIRSVLRRIVDIVGQKSFMDAVSMMARYENVFALGEREMLELALKEAERCLRKQK